MENLSCLYISENQQLTDHALENVLFSESLNELKASCAAKGFRCEITPNEFAWVYDSDGLIGYTFKSKLHGAHPFYFIDDLIKRVNER